LRVRDLTISYGGEPVLEAVNLAVDEGRFVSLVGPSGSGKSSLLRAVIGLQQPLSGTVETHLARSQLGILFQDDALLPWKTALQNVLFPIEMMRRSRSSYLGRAMELLRLVHLDDAVHKRPRELSGGMRQRVSLCRALIADPGVLLMDEPFSALDAITRDDMNIVLLELWERYRKTVLFVTHSIREAMLLADRVLVMGRRPSQIIAEIKVPFPRPRDFAIGETAQFNEVCAALRRAIEIARGSEDATRH